MSPSAAALLMLAGLGATTLAGAAYAYVRRLRVHSSWQSLAARLGLRAIPDQGPAGLRIEGKRNEVSFVLRSYQELLQRRGRWGRDYEVRRNRAVLTVSPPRGLLGFTLGLEGNLKLLRKTLVGEDIQVGDADFDALARVEGREDAALAALSEPVRERFSELLPRGVELAGGKLIWHHDRLPVAGARFSDTAEGMLELAVLARETSRSVAADLASNVAQENDAGVRLRNLEQLIAHHPGDPALARALAVAAGDPDARLRYHAAAAQGEAGFRALLALCQDRGAHPGARAAALEDLAQMASLDPAQVQGVIEAGLFESRRPVRIAAARAAGVLAWSSAAERLCAMLPRVDDEEAEVVAEALHRIGGPEVEGALLPLLEREGEGVRIAAAGALGSLAGLGAVMPLSELTRSLTISREVKQAAQQAVAQIQDRAGATQAGALAITDAAQQGGLAIADGERTGALGIDED